MTTLGHASIGSILEISSPNGAPWEFLVIFATVLLGPVVIERARIPGIIGLLLGGYVIGPHGLNAIGAGNTTLPDLGQLGLLYLMFVAGVELDLNLLRAHRRSAIIFGLLTFALPMLFGTIVGLSLGWEVLAAILLGSLLASHTLITYPTVRDAGLASDPAVATVVGSTVLTDTLTLVVLAAVAGSVGGGRSTLDIAFQLVVGLAVLIGFSLLVLPRLAAWAFRLFGAERSVRYVVAITAFLAAATVAELFGIEGIVGAFFAGLALNRLIPNEGQLMDRIGFFGGAVFIPVFLVSVGLILNPAVIAKWQTLAFAGLFILACLGGKLLAAGLAARLLGFSRPQAGLLFSLSAAQAAATLAATVVGFQIGLFSSAVVNAVLLLIFVSVLASTLAAERASARLGAQEHGPGALGARVVVGVGDPELAPGALAIAVRIARADGGVVQPVLVQAPSSTSAPRVARERLTRAAAIAGVDGSVSTSIDRSLLHGALQAGIASEATLVLVAQPGDPSAAERDAAAALCAQVNARTPPLASVRGSATRLGVVRLLASDSADDPHSLAAEMSRRVARGPVDRLENGDRDRREQPAPRDVTFASWDESLPAAALQVSGILVCALSEADADTNLSASRRASARPRFADRAVDARAPR
ncbi:MAG TPA: cation:proton antiporter [Solirubrobacteraceae bacterium]|nr:cation:proton antiporter [Solirubrobacteraceae bacterium]